MEQAFSVKKIRAVLAKDAAALAFFALESVAETDSTNTRLCTEAREGKALPGRVLIARRQTAGRGRRGRSFSSDEGGVYLSVLLSKEELPTDRTLATVMAAVAAAEAVERVTRVAPGIKWVNDLYLSGKKIAGILTEGASDARTGEPLYTVIGIGVNVKDRAFPPEIAEIAGAIEPLTGRTVSEEAWIGEFLLALYRYLTADGADVLLAEYRRRSCVVGKRVTVMSDAPFSATAREIDDTGALIVEDDAGAIHRLSSGEISVKL